MMSAIRNKPLSDEHRRKLSIAQSGKHHSKETKRKISIARLGKHHSEEARQKISEFQKNNSSRGMLGKHHSIETKRKMSIIATGKIITDETRKKLSKAVKGERSYNWQGGISPKNKRIRRSIESRLWREAVFARDNWICQECEKKGGRLHPHHIKFFSKFPELRFAIDNGLTLCIECHKEIHERR